MKNLILVFVLMLGLASCDKKAEQPSEQKMSFEELSKVIGKDAAFHLFDKAGLTEADPMARGSKKVKNDATLTTLNDLLLEDLGGGNYRLHLSDDAVFAGINNGATGETATSVSFCSTFIPSVTHPETSTGVLDCNTPSTDAKNGYTMDSDFTIHLSNPL